MSVPYIIVAAPQIIKKKKTENDYTMPTISISIIIIEELFMRLIDNARLIGIYWTVNDI